MKPEALELCPWSRPPANQVRPSSLVASAQTSPSMLASITVASMFHHSARSSVLGEKKTGGASILLPAPYQDPPTEAAPST